MSYIVLIIFLGTAWLLVGCGIVEKNFNESKIENIANGITTQTEIGKMFGKPFKTGIQSGQPIRVYEHSHYDQINKDTSKDLIIVFGPNRVVQSHQFMSSQPTSQT